MQRYSNIYLSLILMLLSLVLFGQADYEIKSARKVKMNYAAYPKDMRAQVLNWNKLNHDCLKRVEFGNWFDLKLSDDQVQFTVHTGGRFGDLTDPGIYLGQVKIDHSGRSLTQVKCIQYQGNEGSFHLQASDLDPNGSYFVLVTAPKENLTYGISTTAAFEPQATTAEVERKKITEAFLKIFGRVADKEGRGIAGVPITLLDEGQKTVASTTTNAQGVFRFEALPKDQVYLTRIESDDTELSVEMFLIDEKGGIINRSSRIDGKLYAFGAREDGFPQLNLLTAPNWSAKAVQPGKMAVLGKVVDRATYLNGQSGVKVGLYQKDRTLIQTVETDAQGNFRFDDLEKMPYDVQLKQGEDDYAEVVLIDDLLVPYAYSNSTQLAADGFFTFQELPKDVIRLKRMEAKDISPGLMPDFSQMENGEPIVLRNILFASGSSELLPASYRDLDLLAKALNARPALRIEVSGHTDNSGQAQTNLILSEARAKAVVEYLKKHEVAADRLSYRGYGSQQPVASNDSEEGRKRNRRVVFKVLE